MLSNEQWYERFNTKIDVGAAIGITRQHQVLLEHVAKEASPPIAYENMSPAAQLATRADAEERYLSYVFLRQSGKQHNKLKVDLQNDFTTGDDHYPKTRQATLHLLDKYSKSIIVSHTTPSEGTSFAQRGGRGGGRGAGSSNQNSFDKAYWKDKECYNCNKKGHPSSHCPKKKKTNDDDKSSRTSKSNTSKSNKSAQASIEKEQKKLKKSFATLSSKIEELENESDISNSDSDNEEQSHFQTNFTFAQKDKRDFEQRNKDILFKKAGPKLNLALRNIILLDSQSTMDLFCNPQLVHKIHRSKHSMKLQSNGGTMTVRHKAKIRNYLHDVWFDKHAITNIIALSNLIQQYRVTYDSDDKMFVVHREEIGKRSMHFKMHSSGLHYYDPKDHEFTFVNTVSENLQGYTKRQVKGAELAKVLYSNLGYPSMKDFRWIIQSNQIKDCPVTVEDVDTAHKIFGKDIAALKGKTTRSKA